MPTAFDIRLIGDAALERKLRQLQPTLQRKILAKACRDSAKRMKQAVVQNIEALGLVETGTMLQAFAKAPVRAAQIKVDRGDAQVGPILPTRAALHIDPGDKWYYPTALEYGTKKTGRIPAKAFIRGAVNRKMDGELRAIGDAIANALGR